MIFFILGSFPDLNLNIFSKSAVELHEINQVPGKLGNKIFFSKSHKIKTSSYEFTGSCDFDDSYRSRNSFL